MRTLMALLLVSVSLPAIHAAKKPPQPKPAMLDVVEASARRDANLLLIDGRMKNAGERTAEGLRIIVDVLDSDKRTITTQRGGSEPESIEANAEGEFHAQMPLPPRAVYFRLSFEDKSGRDVKAIKTGPFAIE